MVLSVVGGGRRAPLRRPGARDRRRLRRARGRRDRHPDLGRRARRSSCRSSARSSATAGAARAGWRSTSCSPCCSPGCGCAPRAPRHGLRYLHPLAFLDARGGRRGADRGRATRWSRRARSRTTSTATSPTSSRRGKGRVQAALIVARPVAAADRCARRCRSSPPSARRKFLRKRFVDEISERRVFRPLRPFVQALIRTGVADVLPRLLRRPPLVGRRSATRPTRGAPGGRLPLPDDAIEPPLEPLDRAAAPALRHGGDRLGRRGRDPRLPLRRGRPQGARARARPARRPAPVRRRRGRSSTCGSTTRARSSWPPTSACRCCRACASAAARRSTTRSACDPPELVLEQWEQRGLDRAAPEGGDRGRARLVRRRADPRHDHHGGREALRARRCGGSTCPARSR